MKEFCDAGIPVFELFSITDLISDKARNYFVSIPFYVLNKLVPAVTWLQLWPLLC